MGFRGLAQAELEEGIMKIDVIMGIRKDWSDLGEQEPERDEFFFQGPVCDN